MQNGWDRDLAARGIGLRHPNLLRSASDERMHFVQVGPARDRPDRHCPHRLVTHSVTRPPTDPGDLALRLKRATGDRTRTKSLEASDTVWVRSSGALPRRAGCRGAVDVHVPRSLITSSEVRSFVRHAQHPRVHHGSTSAKTRGNIGRTDLSSRPSFAGISLARVPARLRGLHGGARLIIVRVGGSNPPGAMARSSCWRGGGSSWHPRKCLHRAVCLASSLLEPGLELVVRC
jgi:hypothetical protein